MAAVPVLLAMLCAGCGWRSPQSVAGSYLENLKQYDYSRCYKLLAEKDRSARTLHEFLTEIPLGPDVGPIWFRQIIHASRYDLGEEHREPGANVAFVPVRITAPNLALWERMLDAAASSETSGSDAAQRSLDTGDYPKWTYDDKIFLVKEHHHWRVVAAFDDRDALLERRQAALVAYHNGDFDKAIGMYRDVIASLEKLDATGAVGMAARFSRELDEIGAAKANAAASKAYSSSLKLSGVSMKMSDSRMPAIFGTIANSGARTIDDLRLVVTWYEGRGKDLRQVYREEHPIVLTPIVFTDFSEEVSPLLPGETRRFGFLLNAPAEIEQSASPYVTVGSVVFTPMSVPGLEKHLERVAAGSNATVAAARSTPGSDINRAGGTTDSPKIPAGKAAHAPPKS